MLKVFNKYVRYTAYAGLYQEFESRLMALSSKSSTESLLLKMLDDSFSYFSKGVQDIMINKDDPIEVILEKKEQIIYNTMFMEYLEKAKTQYRDKMLALYHPTHKMVLHSLKPVLVSITEALLSI